LSTTTDRDDSGDGSDLARPSPSSVILICTKDRPDWLGRACEAVARDRETATVVVVDASDDDATADRCKELLTAYPSLQIHYRTAIQPGLTRQRNQGIQFCSDLGVEIVHFLDDDAEILPGYLDAIEDRFRQEADLVCVGGRVQNASAERHPWFNSFFLLSGRYPYTVRSSGRVVMPQPSDGARRRFDQRPVRWLQGFSMSYRMSALREHKFESRFEGYCFGEDRDFAFRVSCRSRLTIEPRAKCLHHSAGQNRLNHRRLGLEATVMTYAWVQEQRSNGLSRIACLWSAFGDLLRHSLAALTSQGPSRKDSVAHARGILEGLRIILIGKASAYAFQNDGYG
jgi:glycosyltransferase involved in cell wall biosynthesis